MRQKSLIVADAAVTTLAVNQWRDGQSRIVKDQLAEEVPIALVYNGVSHAVMLATPEDLEDFALGFSLSEGILKHKNELYDTEVQVHANGVELHLDVAAECFVSLKGRRRSMAGRTGCGLCGTESLDQVFRLPEESSSQQGEMREISANSILKAHEKIKDLQVLQLATGATHACAWANEEGNIELIREDVGRHNALDKLIGALAKLDKKGGFIMTTSRASYEMVQKVVMAGFDLLAAISAPTGLAVRIAQEYNITLLGFVRDKQYVVYSHGARVKH
jgi:FdhD protein